LGNARKLLNDIRDGKSHFHAIEIMACRVDVLVVVVSRFTMAIHLSLKPVKWPFIARMPINPSANRMKIHTSLNCTKNFGSTA
jgi:hypothetical protein